MLGVVMKFGNEVIEVRVINTNVLFRTTTFGGTFTEIKGLKLDKVGVIKEFPDLKDNENWRKIACERFKENIKKINGEEERLTYIINDLKKYGYIPLYLQKSGHRPIKL
jgi:hypothetical protein